MDDKLNKQFEHWKRKKAMGREADDREMDIEQSIADHDKLVLESLHDAWFCVSKKNYPEARRKLQTAIKILESLLRDKPDFANEVIQAFLEFMLAQFVAIAKEVVRMESSSDQTLLVWDLNFLYKLISPTWVGISLDGETMELINTIKEIMRSEVVTNLLDPAKVEDFLQNDYKGSYNPEESAFQAAISRKSIRWSNLLNKPELLSPDSLILIASNIRDYVQKLYTDRAQIDELKNNAYWGLLLPLAVQLAELTRGMELPYHKQQMVPILKSILRVYKDVTAELPVEKGSLFFALYNNFAQELMQLVGYRALQTDEDFDPIEFRLKFFQDAAYWQVELLGDVATERLTGILYALAGASSIMVKYKSSMTLDLWQQFFEVLDLVLAKILDTLVTGEMKEPIVQIGMNVGRTTSYLNLSKIENIENIKTNMDQLYSFLTSEE